MIRLVTVIENTLSGQRGLQIEHGLSFYLETPTIKLIFDFGESGKMFENMVKLNIPYEQVHMAVCSHAHYDHGGGIKYVLPKINLNTLVTGEGFWIEKYKTDGKKFAYLGHGLQQTLLQENAVKQLCCTDVLQLSDDCWAVSGFKRETNFEKIPPRFVLRGENDDFRHDLFEDEVCLAVKTKDGLAVIAGCSHPGIVNMVKTVQDKLKMPVTSVWGGAHLVEADENQIKCTADALRNMGIKRVGLCHCSGEQVLELKKEYPEAEYCRIGTGDTVFL